jgi:tRNA-specific 2-thiouridylase
VRVRYRGDDVPAVIEATGAESFTVVFRSPQPAIAPGQSAVVYRDDEVLGGARIVSSFR